MKNVLELVCSWPVGALCKPRIAALQSRALSLLSPETLDGGYREHDCSFSSSYSSADGVTSHPELGHRPKRSASRRARCPQARKLFSCRYQPRSHWTGSFQVPLRRSEPLPERELAAGEGRSVGRVFQHPPCGTSLTQMSQAVFVYSPIVWILCSLVQNTSRTPGPTSGENTTEAINQQSGFLEVPADSTS